MTEKMQGTPIGEARQLITDPADVAADMASVLKAPVSPLVGTGTRRCGWGSAAPNVPLVCRRTSGWEARPCFLKG
jgi:hypothetical protein